MAKAASSPGSAEAVGAARTAAPAALHRHAARFCRAQMADMLRYELGGGETEQHYGWVNVPLWGLSQQRGSLQLLAPLNGEHPCWECI